MFFLFSKLLLFLLKPLNWVVALGAFSLFSKREKARKKALGWAVGVLVFFSSPVPINLALRAYETPPAAVASLEKTWDVGIVLGGYCDFTTVGPPDLLQFSPAGSRFTQAVELFRAGKFRRFLLSGGSGKLLGSEAIEAERARDFLLKIGVPDSCILIETASRSTAENALFCQKMLENPAPGLDSGGQFGRQFLLISSAWHLPRAAACFEKAGLEVDLFPTDHRAESFEKKHFGLLQPDAEALFEWDFLIKEWVGLAAYRAKGAL